MANESTDVLMTFIDSTGTALAAECASVWNPDDTLKTDFKEGCFFEVDDFSFGGGVEANEDWDNNKSSPGGPGSDRESKNGLRERDDPHQQGKDGGKGRDGSRRRAAGGGRGTRFSAYIHNDGTDELSWQSKLIRDVPEISVSRQIDRCSPYLFWACMNFHSFTKAVIVKRKIIGGFAASGVTVPMMGFLRFEFERPLITSIDWGDGDVIKEGFKFVCRGLTMIYKAQMPDGSLGAQIQGKWKAKTQPQPVASAPWLESSSSSNRNGPKA